MPDMERQRPPLTATMVMLLTILSTLITPTQAFTTFLKPRHHHNQHYEPTTTTFLQSSTPQSEFNALTSALTLLDTEFQNRNKTPDDWIPLKTSSTDTVYLYNPRHPSPPSSVIYFLGGAGFGQYPHISYSTALKRLSRRTDAAVIAAPYEVGLDHFALAKKSGELLRKGVDTCEEEFGWDLSGERVPKFGVGHSLGAKLMAIYAVATGWVEEEEGLNGLGFVSYNNFGFGDSVGMARTFVQMIQEGQTSADRVQGVNTEFLDTVISFATEAVKVVGVEFTPSPEKMEELINTKVKSDLQNKIRMFCFDNDELDSAQGFVSSCESRGPSVAALPGTHLSPVFLKLGVEDLPNMEAQQIFSTLSEFRGVSFGSEDNVNALVSEIERWMVGKPPSREPEWSDWGALRPALVGGVVDAEVEE